jgi:quercetin dioxygenase-like cupin family protein
MKIFRVGDLASAPADQVRYTGEVWTDNLAEGAPPQRIHLARVAFAPGARTAWHRHPFGQILHVVSGVGLVCNAGAAPVRLGPGDTIAIAPGESHWHGATADHAFVHLAMQGSDPEGRMADWGERVDDETYRAAAQLP